MTPTRRPSTSTTRQPSRRTSSTAPTRSSTDPPLVLCRDAKRFAKHDHDGSRAVSATVSTQGDTMTDLLDEAAPSEPGAARYRLVDCDVHPIMRGGMSDLRPYLSRAPRRRLGLDERRDLTTTGHHEAVSIPRNMLYVNQAGVLRDDARAPDGSAPGADPQFTALQLLDA